MLSRCSQKLLANPVFEKTKYGTSIYIYQGHTQIVEVPDGRSKRQLILSKGNVFTEKDQKLLENLPEFLDLDFAKNVELSRFGKIVDHPITFVLCCIIFFIFLMIIREIFCLVLRCNRRV